MHHPSLPAMRSLVLEPDAPLCDLLNDFIQEFVFVNHNYGRSLRDVARRVFYGHRNFPPAPCSVPNRH